MTQYCVLLICPNECPRARWVLAESPVSRRCHCERSPDDRTQSHEAPERSWRNRFALARGARKDGPAPCAILTFRPRPQQYQRSARPNCPPRLQKPLIAARVRRSVREGGWSMKVQRKFQNVQKMFSIKQNSSETQPPAHEGSATHDSRKPIWRRRSAGSALERGPTLN